MPLLASGERSRPAKHNGSGGAGEESSRTPVLPPLPSQEISLYWDLVTTTPPQPAPLLPSKEKKKRKNKIKGAPHRTLWPEQSSPWWVLKASTHCVASLASSVGGGGQVREGVLAAEAWQLAWGEAGTRGSPALGRVGTFTRRWRAGEEESGEELGGLQPQCPADLLLSVTPLPGGQGRQECADFLNPGPLECVSNTRHGAL